MTQRERPKSRVECSRPVTGRDPREWIEAIGFGWRERCIFYNDPASLEYPRETERENEQETSTSRAGEPGGPMIKGRLGRLGTIGGQKGKGERK